MDRGTTIPFHLDITPTPARDRPRGAWKKGNALSGITRHPDGRRIATPVRRAAGGIGKANYGTTGINDGRNGEMRQARCQPRVWTARPTFLGNKGGWNTFRKRLWQQWLRHQTMLINEYRLTPPGAQGARPASFWKNKMEQFFRRSAPRHLEGYVPPQA